MPQAHACQWRGCQEALDLLACTSADAGLTTAVPADGSAIPALMLVLVLVLLHLPCVVAAAPTEHQCSELH